MPVRRFGILVALVALTCVAGTAYAQQRSAECQGLRYSSNFRLNSAKLYLDLAVQKQRTDPNRSQGAMRDAQRQLDAAAQAGGADQMTLEFFYGELATLREDLVGADTMFTKAEPVASPECKAEITRLRRNLWAVYANGATNQQRAGNVDSALALLRRGNVIYRGEPTAFLRMVQIFATRNQTDSAIYYALQAARSSTDPRYAEMVKDAYFVAARLMQGANRPVAAESAFRELLRLTPNDMAGMAGLGWALGAQNRTQAADSIYAALQSVADTATNPDELFDTATEAVRARRYQLAARLLERELTYNRCHRDALYNLASTYNSLHDSVHMLTVARRLVEVDPMNRGSLAMLAQAYVLMHDTASIGTLQRLQSLPWTFDLVGFDSGDTTATLQGTIAATGEQPVQPFRVTFEFLNAACEPVTQTVVEVPQIPANGSQTIDVRGNGRGILAFRYRAN